MAPSVKMCFGKKAEDPEAKKNEEIERQLRLDKKKSAREVKLLLLGRYRLRCEARIVKADKVQELARVESQQS